MRKWMKIMPLPAMLVLLAFGGYEIALQNAYAHIESLTRQHGTQIQPALSKTLEKEGKWVDGVYKITLEYIKVFDITPVSAKVFVVTDFNVISAGDSKIIDREGQFKYLNYQGGNWQVDTTKPIEVIWSWYSTELIKKSTWPPYR